MGGFFGAISKRDCVLDIFFGTDYHSHLGTRRGGMAIYDPEGRLPAAASTTSRTLPSAPSLRRIWRTFTATSGIGCISDTDPQPLLVRSHLGLYRHHHRGHDQQRRGAGGTVLFRPSATSSWP